MKNLFRSSRCCINYIKKQDNNMHYCYTSFQIIIEGGGGGAKKNHFFNLIFSGCFDGESTRSLPGQRNTTAFKFGSSDANIFLPGEFPYRKKIAQIISE
jgi:hypothetical protein